MSSGTTMSEFCCRNTCDCWPDFLLQSAACCHCLGSWIIGHLFHASYAMVMQSPNCYFLMSNWFILLSTGIWNRCAPVILTLIWFDWYILLTRITTSLVFIARYSLPCLSNKGMQSYQHIDQKNWCNALSSSLCDCFLAGNSTAGHKVKCLEFYPVLKHLCNVHTTDMNCEVLLTT